jgi:hypothetical protein
MNEKMLEKKKDDYYSKKGGENKRFEELSKVHQKEEEEKKQREWEKEKKRLDVLKQNEKIMEQRKTVFLHKLNVLDVKTQAAQAKLYKDLQHKKDLDHLKMIDKQDNIERIKQVQEYKRMKILEKLEEDNKRTEQMRLEQEQIIATRQKIRRDMDEQKEKMVNDFYLKQKKNNQVKNMKIF